MIRKIAADQLVIGMYIHDLNCGWMSHPFLTSQFEIKSADTLHKIQELGIKIVFIDTNKGRDLVEENPVTTADAEDDAAQAESNSAATEEPAYEEPGSVVIKKYSGQAPIIVAKPELADEVRRARRLHNDASRLMANMMHDVRLGKQIEVEQCEPVVEGILDSIFRLPSALLPLAQVKQQDEYTFQHSVSVSALAVAFGRTLDLPKDVIKDIALGGLLHDVGKALVPSAILNKPGKLTDDEFAIMKGHAAHTAELLKNAKGVSPIAYHAAAEHHERYDGSGYPLGLKGEEITLYGQMICIADVYDAITSLRVYHKGMPPTEALRKLFEWSKTHFSERLVQAFIKGIGIYPAGSLVRLESGHMGIVREVVPDKILQPVVKVFYHADKLCYIPPKTVDLSSAKDKIVAHESFEKWGIDQAAWL